MNEWIDAEARLPEVGPEGRSDLVVFDHGKETVSCRGRLVRLSNGKLEWISEEPPAGIPEPQPAGYSAKRWIRRWRPLESQ